MKVFNRLLSSLLLAISLFGAAPPAAQAQPCDTLTFRPELGLERSWTYAIFNRNPSFKQINKVTLQITTPGVIYDPFSAGTTSSPPATYHGWNVFASNPTLLTDSVDPPPTGQPIPHGFADSTFDLSFDTSALQKYTCIQWTTYFVTGGNTTQICSGTTCLFTRYDQFFQPHDTATVTSSILPSCDVSFNFRIFNRNGLYQPIQGLKFSLVGAGGGNALTMRPSAIKAPDGWVLDSVTASDAYFHANGGSGIGPGSNQDGFILTARGNPSQHAYTFEWTAYTYTDASTLTHIDYGDDTIAAIPCANTVDESTDTLAVAGLGGCAYTMTLKNFHVSQDKPTSPITEFFMVSQTPGVTFESSPNSAPGWAVYIPPAHQDSLYYIKLNSAPPLAGGLSNSFSVVMSNPSQVPYTLHWATTDSAGTASTGNLLMTKCTTPPTGPDSVNLVLPPNYCNYTAVVKNLHYPNPSAIHAVSLSVNSSQATFGPIATSNFGWSPSFGGGNASLRFTASNSDMVEFQSQNIAFSLVPVVPGTPVYIHWVTYDAANNPILSGGNDTATCMVKPPTCDTVTFTHSTTGLCMDSIRVYNSRPAGEGAVNDIQLVTSPGWTIDSAHKPLGWSDSIYLSRDTLHFTGPGVSTGTKQGGFVVWYRPGNGVTSPYTVNVTTYNGIGTKRACSYFADHITCIQQFSTVLGSPVETISLSAHPNPFSGRTEVTFTLPEHEHVNLVLVDVMGRVQRTVGEGMMETGDHAIAFDGSSLPAGTYYLRLETPYSRVTKKLAIER